MKKPEALALSARLERAAMSLEGIEGSKTENLSLDEATASMRAAAAAIRTLAENQLPEWDSITPATPESRAAEVVQAWAEKVSHTAMCVAASARLGIAAAWIKQRDEEIGRLRTQLSQRMLPPQAFEPPGVHAAAAFRELFGANLGEFIDARRLGGALSESDPIPAPSLPDLPNSSEISDALQIMTKLAATVVANNDMQREHWRAMEHQTRRIADANALRALSVADKLETVEGEALLSRIRSDALK